MKVEDTFKAINKVMDNACEEVHKIGKEMLKKESDKFVVLDGTVHNKGKEWDLSSKKMVDYMVGYPEECVEEFIRRLKAIFPEEWIYPYIDAAECHKQFRKEILEIIDKLAGEELC